MAAVPPKVFQVSENAKRLILMNNQPKRYSNIHRTYIHQLSQILHLHTFLDIYLYLSRHKQGNSALENLQWQVSIEKYIKYAISIYEMIFLLFLSFWFLFLKDKISIIFESLFFLTELYVIKYT